jgi:hypothetical protein
VKRKFLFLFSSFFLLSCTPNQPVQTEMVNEYATSAAQPWMGELFACANEQSIVVNVTAESPDIVLRVANLELSDGLTTFPAYQIGEEEIVIAVNHESPIQDLTLEEAQMMFAGQVDESVQVWVYASGEDLQGLFDQVVMKGRSVTSFARVVANPQEMSDVLNSESDAMGFLPKRWAVENLRVIYSLGNFPVLAITKEEPQGAVSVLLGCLQNN